MVDTDTGSLCRNIRPGQKPSRYTKADPLQHLKNQMKMSVKRTHIADIITFFWSICRWRVEPIDMVVPGFKNVVPYLVPSSTDLRKPKYIQRWNQEETLRVPRVRRDPVLTGATCILTG